MSPTPDDRTLLTEFTLDRRVLVEWTVLGTGMTLVSLFAFVTVFAMGTGRTSGSTWPTSDRGSSGSCSSSC